MLNRDSAIAPKKTAHNNKFKPGIALSIFNILSQSASYLINNPVTALTYYLLIIGNVLSKTEAANTNGLVAYYPLNGSAMDFSGYGNHGKTYGLLPAPDRWGQKDKALYFNGNGYARGFAGSIFPYSKRTVTAWIKLDKDVPAGEIGGSIFGYGGNVCGTSWVMDINNKCSVQLNAYEVQAHCWVNEVQYVDSSIPNSSSEWTFIAITTDAVDGTRIYINATSKSHSQKIYFSNTFVSGTDFGIGTLVDGNTGKAPYEDACVSNFKGIISELNVYDNALSQNEITEKYNEKPVVPPTPEEPTFFERNEKYIIPTTVATSAVALLCCAVGIFRKKCLTENSLNAEQAPAISKVAKRKIKKGNGLFDNSKKPLLENLEMKNNEDNRVLVINDAAQQGENEQKHNRARNV